MFENDKYSKRKYSYIGLENIYVEGFNKTDFVYSDKNSIEAYLKIPLVPFVKVTSSVNVRPT